MRCACGADVDAPAIAQLVVCPKCGRTIAAKAETEPSATIGVSETVPALLVDPAGGTRVGLSETVPAFVASGSGRKEPLPPVEASKPRAATTKPSTKPRYLLFVTSALLAAGLVVAIVMVAQREPAAIVARDVGVAVVDAGAVPPLLPVHDPDKLSTSAALAMQLRTALARVAPAELAPLFTDDVFAFGTEASDVETGRDRAIAMLLRDLGRPARGGFTIDSTFSRVGVEQGAAWFVDEILVVGATPGNPRQRRFVMTYLAVEQRSGWKIAAIHFALSVPNKLAFDLGKLELLPVPKPIESGTTRIDSGTRIDNSPGATELEAAFRTAFASRAALIEAWAARPDAYNRGSAPGENAIGGSKIKATFERMTSEIHVQDGVTVATPLPTVGWGAANIAFTMTIDNVLTTQIFRMLGVFVKEASGWKLVSAHWSNAGPIPRLPDPAGTPGPKPDDAGSGSAATGGTTAP